MDDLDLIRSFRVERGDGTPQARAEARARLSGAIDQARTTRMRSGRRLGRRWMIAISAAAGVLVAGAAIPLALHLTGTHAAPVTYAEAVSEFPNETAADVVSVADRVVLVTVTKAVELPDKAPKARAAAGEGVLNRMVTFRIDRTVWQRAGARRGPASFDGVWWGWTVHESKRTKMVGEGAPWVQVGGQYLMPVKFRNGKWEAVQPFATFRVTESVVALEPRQTSPLARQLSGTSVGAATRLLDQAVAR